MDFLGQALRGLQILCGSGHPTDTRRIVLGILWVLDSLGAGGRIPELNQLMMRKYAIRPLLWAAGVSEARSFFTTSAAELSLRQVCPSAVYLQSRISTNMREVVTG